MPPQADRSLARLVTRYSDASNALRARVATFLRTSWLGLGSWRDADIDRFVSQIVPVVQGSQRQMASLTDAYLATVARQVLGAGRPVGIPAGVLDDLRGVPIEDVYRRPASTTYASLANGDPFNTALNKGLGRLLVIAATDLQLARTHAARHVISSDPRITSFRRVTNGECCELCDSAADDEYRTGDLMPIHANCSCDVEPVYEAADPGRLEGGTPSGEDQGDKPEVRDHGELGPVLVVAGQQFSETD